MDYFDYIINKNAAKKENPGKLSSYREAAELICMCWNRLDMSFVAPYLDENIIWKGGEPYKVIKGKPKNMLYDHQIQPIGCHSAAFYKRKCIPVHIQIASFVYQSK